MIRGALILGIGFSLGYAKALHDSEDIKEKLTQILDLAKEANERSKTADTEETPDDTVASDAIEVAPETPVGDTP
jgi:hypothetical protein